MKIFQLSSRVILTFGLLIGVCLYVKTPSARAMVIPENISFADFLTALLPSPEIINVIPQENSLIFSETHIKLIWNQPVDHDSFSKQLKISPDLPLSDLRILKISWDYQNEPNAMTVFFEPNFPEYEVITIEVQPGVKALFGEKRSSTGFRSSFKTLPKFPFKFQDFQNFYKKILSK